MTEMTAEMEALKSRLKATWMSGDYGHYATHLEPGALELLARVCGVTGVDFASNLIAQAQAQARAEGGEIQFEEGDAEMLSFPDASHDLAVSRIGAMFAPRPENVAAELVRVCKPGGRIVMANWTPEGHVGQMFKIICKHVPPPPLMASPVKWGDEATARERLQVGTPGVNCTRHLYPMRYPFSPAEVAEFFFTYYGPTLCPLAALDAAGQATLREDLVQLWTKNNRARDDTTSVEAEYLEMHAIRSSVKHGAGAARGPVKPVPV